MGDIGPTYTGPTGAGMPVTTRQNFHKPEKYVDPGIQRAKDQKTAFDKAMDVDLEYGWQVHDQDIQLEMDNYRNKIAGWYKQGGDMNDPDFLRQVKSEQDRIGLVARRSNYMKEIDTTTRARTKADTEYNQSAINDELNRASKVFDENGKMTDYKDAFDMNEEDWTNAEENPDTFDMDEVIKNALLSFKDVAHQAYEETLLKYGTKQQVTDWSGKLITWNENGEVKINLGANQKKVLMMSPKMKLYVEQQEANKVPEEKIWQPVKTALEAKVGIKKSQSRTNYPEWRVKGNEPAPPPPSTDSEPAMIRTATPQKDGTVKTTNTFTPAKYELGDLPEGEREIDSEGLEYTVRETGEKKKAKPGGTPFKLSSIHAVYWINTSKGLKYNGQIFGSEKDLYEKMLNNPDIGLKYMAQGTYAADVTKNVTGAEITKPEETQVTMPYEQIRATFKASTKKKGYAGYDLNDKPISEFSPPEIVNAARSFDPSLTKMELLKLVDQVKGLANMGQTLTREDLGKLVKFIKGGETKSK